jgi:hypothetical protein
MQKNSIVTVDLGQEQSASNTFLIDTIEDETVLVTHPLACGLLMRVGKCDVDVTAANLKDSIERGIDFANSNRSMLDFSTLEDLDALGISFVFKRKLTSNQKQVLANICGSIACYKFDDNIKKAMEYISKNQAALDDFNLMWFNNFKSLFAGTQVISSKKQRTAIFNIAGYILAESENPTVNRRR